MDNSCGVTKVSIGSGLCNLGKSCFFNSIIQALFHIPRLENVIRLELDRMDIKKCMQKGTCITCGFLTLFKAMQCSQSPFKPIDLYEALKKTNNEFRKILNGSDQDPHEFLMLVADEMDKQEHYLTWFEENFVADINTVVECSICKSVYESDGTIRDFALDINGQKSAQAAMDLYFDSESVEGYYCVCCAKRVRAKKQFSLSSIPPCLCVQLKRFSKSRGKLQTNVEISPELNISKYFTDSSIHELKYKLVSVINHLGKTRHSGHYTTIIRTRNEEYYEFDDEAVRNATASSIKGNEAYLLFYELIEEIDNSEVKNQDQLGNEFLLDQHEENYSKHEDLTQKSLQVEHEVNGVLTQDSRIAADANKENTQPLVYNKSCNDRDIDNVTETKTDDTKESETDDANESQTAEESETDDANERETDDANESETDDATGNEIDNASETETEYDTKTKTQNTNVLDENSETETDNENEEINLTRNGLESDRAHESDVETENETETQNNGQNQNVSREHIDKLSGCRIVDIKYFFEQIERMSKNTCKTCYEGEMKFEKEFKKGLISFFTFKCTSCGKRKRLESCPLKNNKKANINQAAVTGIVSIGLGHYHLQELFAHLDVTTMSYPTYHKLDKQLQENTWKLAKQLEEEALQEEIRLAIEIGDVDSAGNALIPAQFDGSWGKRSYGSNFSSLSGCAAIIGLRTGKVLYSDVKNKYCHICAIAESRIEKLKQHECSKNNEEPSSGVETYCETCTMIESCDIRPKEHKCNKNYDGPSSGMETQIIVEGFKFCEEKGARFTKYVGDGDSSTYKALRDLRLYRNPDLEIEKFECVNHLFRNFRKAFTKLLANAKLALRGRKLLKATLGADICIGIRMAADHWRKSNIDILEKYSNLERDVMNAPLHYLGVHDKCQPYFCKKITDASTKTVMSVLKDTGVLYEIMDLCQSYFFNNAKSLIANLSTNKTEGFNSLIAKTLGGKRVCNSLAGSYQSRTAMADIHHNTEGHSGSRYHEFAFGETLQSCLKLENTRKRKLEKNAIAKKAKPKKKRFSDGTNKTKKKKHYGLGHGDVDYTPSQYQLAKDRLLKKLVEDQLNRDLIEIDTRGQRHVSKWIVTRKNLLTPSYFGRILNVNNRKSYTKIVEEILYKNEKFSNTAEVRHQRMFEEEALQLFCGLYESDSISSCGIFIDAEFPFLGTSPFRLYGHDSIISVKCPKAGYKKSMKVAIDKNLIPFWSGTFSERRINLKSYWWYEIQGQLRITGRRFAYLVIYLGESVYEIMEKIERNDEFWKNKMENELTFFYNEAMLKEIVNPRYDRGMDLRTYNAASQTFE